MELRPPRGLRGIAYKPYLWRRPTRLLRRNTPPDGDGLLPLTTAFGLPITCFDDHIGSSIRRTGVHELVITEAVVRLVDRGDVAVDVGANVGYTALVCALAAGPRGRVVAVEAHPDVSGLLRRNVAAWSADAGLAPIDPLENAASTSSGGVVRLAEPLGYAGNRGVARVDDAGTIPVETVAIDDLGVQPHLLKLDVEGHETFVLDGAVKLLQTGHPRDVLFEASEHAIGLTERLSSAGFELFGLSQDISKPVLVAADAPQRHWDAPMLLATRDPDRARRRFTAVGWQCLRRRRAAPSPSGR